MKKFVSALLSAFIFTAAANAQSLEIIDFKTDPADLSAVVHQVNDLNGNPCGLVKVGLAAPDVTFEGDIIQSEFKDGEYWVYMVDGANWITVKSGANEFTPLRIDQENRPDFGTVKGNTTYILTLVVRDPNSGGIGGPKPARIPIELPAKGGGVSIGGVKQKGTKPVKFDMILVKSGTFRMGATPEQMSNEADENPVHTVRFTRDIYMGETEVSQQLWDYVMGNNPSYIKDEADDLPVENITWDEAQDFCHRLSQITGVTFRLPTESEWEYAARGGHKATPTRYAGTNNLGEAGWFLENSSGRSHNVKSGKPNELGLYNMSGNVWELCQDYKNDYPNNDVTDYICSKPAKNKNRVRRGGAWDSDNIDQLRIAYRRRIEHDRRDCGTGLRIVMEP